MLIITDRKIPAKAAETLAGLGEVLFVDTKGITYDAVSGHPDVFMCQLNEVVVVAPNAPGSLTKALELHGIRVIPGETPVGSRYPGTAAYNAVCSGSALLHNFRYTDPVITALAADLDMDLIHLNQGYSRCNLLPLPDGSFITSDEGIERVLASRGLEVLKVDPEGILLPGFRHGFIGGTAGSRGDTIYFTGSLDLFPDGEPIHSFLAARGFRLVELYDGPLADVGSLFFLSGLAGH